MSTPHCNECDVVCLATHAPICAKFNEQYHQSTHKASAQWLSRIFCFYRLDAKRVDLSDPFDFVFGVYDDAHDLPQEAVLQHSNLPNDDEDLQQINHLPKLRFLGLDGTNLTPAGLASFEKGPHELDSFRY